jgi:glycosyltransferase involved in cell wall biosynthesis
VKVALFGGYDPAYPRVRVLRESLESQGIEVRDLGAPPRAGGAARWVACLAAWATRGRGIDALLVPAFGHRDVLLAAVIGRLSGVPVLFDPLVSRWDTQVGDLGRVRAGSMSARRLRWSDRLSLSLADLVLCDTWEHADFYSAQFGISRRNMARIPVGADRATYRLAASRSATGAATAPLRVVYVGGFLPLHGMETIVAAATLLERRHGAGFAHFTLIGGGMLANRTARDVAAAGLRSVRMPGRVSYDGSMAAMAAADVALGIFGRTPKAARVVPHKVFQAMALGVPTVTRRSAAIAEFFPDEDTIGLVPAGDPEALARAIESLAGDPGKRARRGEAGRAASRAAGHPERIGPLLVEAIGRARDRTAPVRKP